MTKKRFLHEDDFRSIGVPLFLKDEDTIVIPSSISNVDSIGKSLVICAYRKDIIITSLNDDIKIIPPIGLGYPSHTYLLKLHDCCELTLVKMNTWIIVGNCTSVDTKEGEL